MNSRVGRLGGHSHDSRNLTFLFRSREATTHRVYLNEVDTPLAAFKRVSVVLISGVGALLLFIGLTYDYWDPNRYPGFGYKQFTVTFIGAILVAIPIIYLLSCSYPLASTLLCARQPYILGIAFGLCLLSEYCISDTLPFVSHVGLYAYFVLFCFLLPVPAAFISLTALFLL